MYGFLIVRLICPHIETTNEIRYIVQWDSWANCDVKEAINYRMDVIFNSQANKLTNIADDGTPAENGILKNFYYNTLFYSRINVHICYI